MSAAAGADRTDDLAARLDAIAARCHDPATRERSSALADLLTSLEVGPEIPLAGALLPALRDGDLERDDAAELAGAPAADLAAVAARLERPAPPSREVGLGRDQADALRKLLLALMGDVRGIVVRLADQVLALREARHLEPEARVRLARETRTIYAPLASRLGIWQLKWELEDLSFRFLEPEAYRRIASQLAERRSEREAYIQEFVGTLRDAIVGTGVQADIQGRPKHLYSIHRKMQRKNVDLDQIFDALAVRILVDDIPACYTVLGMVHGRWRYIPGEFDDYITSPKGNYYRSIHTAVHGPGGRAIEVQIRTHEMHAHAELGVAAHWRYKEGGGQEDEAFQRKIAWLRQLLDPAEGEPNDADFIDRFRSELLEDRIYVFTPQGAVIDLPQGATPLDFAYHVHTEVGHRCRGARVDGRMVPLTFKLSTGQQVEILRAKEPRPSRDWLIPQLGFLKSGRARSKVRTWFRHQDFDRNRDVGKELLERELARMDLKQVEPAELARRFRQDSVEALHAALGNSDITHAELVGTLEHHYVQRERSAPGYSKRRGEARTTADEQIRIGGVGDLMTNLARCCNPVPGEAVIGFITRGRGVTVHRADCGNVLRQRESAPERFIEVDWTTGGADPYPVDVVIYAVDRRTLMHDTTKVLSEMDVNILAVNSRSDTRRGSARIDLSIEVQDLESLSAVIARLNRIPGVNQAKRRG